MEKFSLGNAAMFLCGDDSNSKKIVLHLAEQIGFESFRSLSISNLQLTISEESTQVEYGRAYSTCAELLLPIIAKVYEVS